MQRAVLSVLSLNLMGMTDILKRKLSSILEKRQQELRRKGINFGRDTQNTSKRPAYDYRENDDEGFER